MFINYNGIGLSVDHVTQWSDRNIYTEDGGERLYRHVTFQVQFVVHPATIAGLVQAGATSAPQIILAIKKALLTPRQNLVVTIGDTVVLRTPELANRDPKRIVAAASTHYTDARTGPNPIHCDVTSIHGIKTFLGTFAIETWLVDENTEKRGAQSALIANRWEMQTSIDQDYLCNRVIVGRAIFRGDFLYEQTDKGDYRQVARRPSDFLAYLDHPTPCGYKRIGAEAKVSSDGLSITYVLVDQEQATVINPKFPVSRVEAMWKSGHAAPGFMPTGLINYVSLVIHVWGRRDDDLPKRRGQAFGRTTTRQDLINFAVLVARAYGFANPLNCGAYKYCDLAVDLVGKFVSLEVSYRLAGVIAGAVGMALPTEFLLAPGKALTQFFGVDIEALLSNAIGDVSIANRFPEDTILGEQDLLIASRFLRPLRPPLGNVGSGAPALKTQSLRDGNTVPSPGPLYQNQELRTPPVAPADRNLGGHMAGTAEGLSDAGRAATVNDDTARRN